MVVAVVIAVRRRVGWLAGGRERWNRGRWDLGREKPISGTVR